MRHEHYTLDATSADDGQVLYKILQGDILHHITEHGYDIVKTRYSTTRSILTPAGLKELFDSIGEKPPRKILRACYGNMAKINRQRRNTYNERSLRN